MENTTHTCDIPKDPKKGIEPCGRTAMLRNGLVVAVFIHGKNRYDLCEKHSEMTVIQLMNLIVPKR
jgi:hypothetical protein